MSLPARGAAASRVEDARVHELPGLGPFFERQLRAPGEGEGVPARIPVYAAQARGASVDHDSFHARRPLTATHGDIIADGLATRATYALTFEALLAGIEDLLAVREAEIAEGVRTLIKQVAIVMSGANVDQTVLRRILGPRSDPAAAERGGAAAVRLTIVPPRR